MTDMEKPHKAPDALIDESFVVATLKRYDARVVLPREDRLNFNATIAPANGGWTVDTWLLDSEKPVDLDLMIIAYQKSLVETEYQRQRAAAYPSVAELADALYWQSQGDDAKMTAYLAKCDAVKKAFPKPS